MRILANMVYGRKHQGNRATWQTYPQAFPWEQGRRSGQASRRRRALCVLLVGGPLSTWSRASNCVLLGHSGSLPTVFVWDMGPNDAMGGACPSPCVAGSRLGVQPTNKQSLSTQ